jgi:hypothetical protein
LTNFVKNSLLLTAAQSETELAINKLCTARGQLEFEEGYAFALCTWDDALEYMKDTPPDGWRMLVVCQHITFLALILHEQRSDLPLTGVCTINLEAFSHLIMYVGSSQSPAHCGGARCDTSVDQSWTLDTQKGLAAAFIQERLPSAAREWDVIALLAFAAEEV